uniref:MSP domain-containing protein n=1 Tax=Heterorhabditis bacteriophora TaxID=37862 RepID=A0A1I7WBB4_HETBA
MEDPLRWEPCTSATSPEVIKKGLRRPITSEMYICKKNKIFKIRNIANNNCFKQVSSLNFYEFTPIISVTVVVSRIISISPFICLCLSISSLSLLKWLQIDSSPGGLLHLTALKLVNIYIYVHWNCRWKALGRPSQECQKIFPAKMPMETVQVNQKVNICPTHNKIYSIEMNLLDLRIPSNIPF